MNVFADTNFYTNLWLELSHQAEAARLHNDLLQSGGILPVTRFLRMELTNALHRLIFESRHGVQGIRVSWEAALATRASFDDELLAGDFLEWRVIPGDKLEIAFETVAYRHTARRGFRTYDILHVASALVLGCDTFWSFDVRANQLASLEGLRTNSAGPASAV